MQSRSGLLELTDPQTVFHTDKYRGIYSDDLCNCESERSRNGREGAACKTESWNQGIRGRFALTWSHLAVWTFELQLRYHRFQVHIYHL